VKKIKPIIFRGKMIYQNLNREIGEWIKEVRELEGEE